MSYFFCREKINNMPKARKKTEEEKNIFVEEKKMDKYEVFDYFEQTNDPTQLDMDENLQEDGNLHEDGTLREDENSHKTLDEKNEEYIDDDTQKIGKLQEYFATNLCVGRTCLLTLLENIKSASIQKELFVCGMLSGGLFGKHIAGFAIMYGMMLFDTPFSQNIFLAPHRYALYIHILCY